jgi:hypothetical protein
MSRPASPASTLGEVQIFLHRAIGDRAVSYFVVDDADARTRIRRAMAWRSSVRRDQAYELRDYTVADLDGNG